ncbi:DEAD/DEAH box helicase [Longispora sp. K20-0274]|uniref:DEAD/DEAH box helicase n=1 Tax=Longispora sp. K20-0274 TaxID=3088255 RepID=UPI00399AA868
MLRPRDIYAALPKRPWPYLRHEQGEVLEKWYERRRDRDVVIKQNTGGGKTVAGLLIAQSTLNEGIGKAVYLAPDKYLAAQVRIEAVRLGLATTDDSHDPSFRTHEAILVTTFQWLINGISVYGSTATTATSSILGSWSTTTRTPHSRRPKDSSAFSTASASPATTDNRWQTH